MERIRVHPRVHERHPDISDENVSTAWENAIALIERRTEEKDFLVAIGFDDKGRLLEMVSTQDYDGVMMVFHAMAPPAKRTLKSLA